MEKTLCELVIFAVLVSADQSFRLLARGPVDTALLHALRQQVTVLEQLYAAEHPQE